MKEKRNRAGQGSDNYKCTVHAEGAGTARTADALRGGNFLCRQKVTKELPRGDAECRAPARQSRSPLGTPLGAHLRKMVRCIDYGLVRRIHCNLVCGRCCGFALSVWLVPRQPALPEGGPWQRKKAAPKGAAFFSNVTIPSGTQWCNEYSPADARIGSGT